MHIDTETDKKMRGQGLLRHLARAVLAPVYKVYEHVLWRQIRRGVMPRHIGIIPDGNRRWASMNRLPAWLGHREGYRRIRETLEWLWDLGVETVTIYTMSTENCLYRSPEERKRLFELAERGLREILEDRDAEKRGLRVKVIGRLDLAPPHIVELARQVEEETGRRNGPLLYVALCYGGRQEILDAVRRIAEEVRQGRLSPEDIDEEVFRKRLYTSEAPDPDLIIRTSGEERISNFLLWQSAYSELYFCEAYWPEFRRIDLWRAIRSYQRRQRRFGR